MLADGTSEFCFKPLMSTHSVDLFGRPSNPKEEVMLYFTADDRILVNLTPKKRLVLLDKEGYKVENPPLGDS